MARMMIVEDDAESRYMLSSLLSGHGHDVVEATNGADALHLAHRQPPDVVVSDVLMPEMDGFTLCREWMKDERLRRIPLVLYTATYTDTKDQELAMAEGARRFLVKPMEPEALLSSLDEVIREADQIVPVDHIGMHHWREAEELRLYNDRLVKKVEHKMLQLEKANAALVQQMEAQLHAERERERVEQVLRVERNNLHSLIVATPIALLVLDAAGEVVHANPAAERMFGVVDFGVANMRSGDLLKCAHRHDDAQGCGAGTACAKCLINAAIREGLTGASVHEREIETDLEPHGVREHRWLVVNVEPMIRNGKRHCVVALHDISGLKHAEAERTRLEDQLRSAQKMDAIGSLAGGIAHDFNNLLSVIMCCVSVALETASESDVQRENLLEIQKAGQRAADLTRQLLAFSRKQILQPVPLSLNEVLPGIDKMLQRILGEDIEVMHVLDPGLGLATADPGQIEQVIVNLVVNARDAMPGGGTVTIETRNTDLDEAYANSHVAVKPGPYVMLAVSDTGCGMDAQTRARVFEPFFTTKAEGKGTGLGLSMVYGIVKQSGGNIWVYSEKGQGTTIKIYLPRLKVLVAPRQRVSGVSVRASGTETILVVEDEDSVRHLVQRILSASGYTVLTAPNGDKALEICEVHGREIHLVLTDVVMPHMSGKILMERLAVISPKVKALYMSGYTDGAIEQHHILEPGTQFIGKPFSAAALCNKVREVLDAAKDGERVLL